jgi:guanylate kinase/non-canonical purine NTP pyrophosphatase (RdgB/HAM1 family)
LRKIVLASANPGKLRELAALLEPLGLGLIAQSALGIASAAETGSTFLENALIKARHAAHLSGLPALADDSGIEVDALGGRPGVRSARFAGKEASDEDNLQKLLAEMHEVPSDFRQARYHCVIALVRSAADREPIVAHGTWEGEIARAPRGRGGFGYDPIFVPSGSHHTAAELDAAEKNAVSHRAQALRRLLVLAREELGGSGPKSHPGAVKRGRLFVLAAPSGAGKTSLVKALLARVPRLSVSISHTTRRRRPSEEEAREYYFVTVPEFERLIAQGQFLEHARVFDNFYGTGRAPVEARLAAGGDMVLEIDWQGARQVRDAMPECTTIFILPPSREALERRLRSRATDAPEVIARRLRDAVSDMSRWREFDYVVVNDDFERAVADLQRIVEGHGEAFAAGRAELAPLLRRLLA